MTVVVQLLGGLGNQLFQYSVGRALAIKHGVALGLDTSSFDRYPLRPYALRHFAIKAVELTATQCRELHLDNRPMTRLLRALSRLRGSRPVTIIRERGFRFDSSILEAPADCYLQGYWQSPNYFRGIESAIRNELRCKERLNGDNLATATQILESPAVAVHIRRGDYVTNAQTERYHGTCGVDYYQAAERYLLERFGPMRLFVFSDDPDWAEANLRVRSPVTVLRHNGPERGYEDLRLMTMCRHHIIANSTFSWWGAWLCQNPGKVVIAPKNWFKEANHDTSDLIPEGWIRL